MLLLGYTLYYASMVKLKAQYYVIAVHVYLPCLLSMQLLMLFCLRIASLQCTLRDTATGHSVSAIVILCLQGLQEFVQPPLAAGHNLPLLQQRQIRLARTIFRSI